MSHPEGLFNVTIRPGTVLVQGPKIMELCVVLGAALKIVGNVVRFRVQRLEMANLAAACAILLALRAEPVDAAVRACFGLLLNVLSYLNNDYLDVRADLHAQDRNTPMTRYLYEHMDAALAAQWGLVACMALMVVTYDPGLIVPLVAGGGVCVAYSAWLKARPFGDVLAMTVWGVAMPAVAFPIDLALGWGLAGLLGLFSMVFELLQVLRDRQTDTQEGIRTTAVVLGPHWTRRLVRVAMLLCALYCAALLHPVAGLVLLGALVLPVRQDSAARDWTRVKLLYGVVWLGLCAMVFARAEAAGLCVTLRLH